MKYQYIKLGSAITSDGERVIKKTRNIGPDGKPEKVGVNRYYAKLNNPTKQWENKGKKEAERRLAKMKKGKE